MEGCLCQNLLHVAKVAADCIYLENDMALSNLDDTKLIQGTLFEGKERRETQSRVEAVADEIKGRFGAGFPRRRSRPTELESSASGPVPSRYLPNMEVPSRYGKGGSRRERNW